MAEKSEPVTMRDVAKAAGVSRMSVSRALKEDAPMHPETREKIMKVVREMNYIPDQMAGSLSTKKSGFVVALLPSLNNLHFAQTVHYITEELQDTGLKLLLGHTSYVAHKEQQMLEAMLSCRPEAVILSNDGHTERTRELLQNARVPVIEIWEKPENPMGYTVGFSNFDASYAMTKALVAQGFQKIVFLSEIDEDWTRGSARRKGFVQAMSDHGLETGFVLRYGQPPLSIESGAIATPILLEQFPDVECIFCVSDPAAFGVLNALSQRGISVPEDISVVGFGDFEVSRFSHPSISTVVVDPETIGRKAGELVKQLLGYSTESSSSCTPKQEYCVPFTLDFRDSSRSR